MEKAELEEKRWYNDKFRNGYNNNFKTVKYILKNLSSSKLEAETTQEQLRAKEDAAKRKGETSREKNINWEVCRTN